MGTLNGPVICRPVVHGKHSRASCPRVSPSSLKTKAGLLTSGFWGCKGKCRLMVRATTLVTQPCQRKSALISCNFSSSSDDNDSMAENFSESDGDYVNSSVTEAVEVRSGSDGFFIKMRDGRNLRCAHNNPQGGPLPDYAPHSAIVLKMEDGSDILLPIIVLEMPTILLMAAIRNVQIARPTIYQVVKEMIDKMGYQVQVVRVTKRVHEAYFAQMHLTKAGNEKECISFDLRPSDAINLAVRCKCADLIKCHRQNHSWPKKVPIQVNRHLAYSDGMKVVEPSTVAVHAPLSGLLFTELDRPDGQPCLETKEFGLVRNMLIAAVEERYRDAAQWRDKLTKLRSKRRNWA